MKKFIIILSIFSSLVVSACATEKPNFIIIYTDDQGYQDLGSFGSPDLKTPRIDQLAEEGLKLTSFYAQPVCGPSRASLLTGAYPIRIGEVGNEKEKHPRAHPEEVMLGEFLKDAGYRTGMVGKWHLAGLGNRFIEANMPPSQGFDYFFGVRGSNDSGLKRLYRNREVIEHDIDLNTVTRRYTEEAIEFVERNKDRPFFLYLAHTMPHVRLGVDPEFRGTSEQGLYGDVIHEIDYRTGQLIDVLKEHGLDKNTYVIYASDNGPWLSKGNGSALPLSGGKVTTQEGGVRVPCIMWAPGRIAPGRTYEGLTKTMDVFPTFAEIIGKELPQDRVYDGESLLPVLTGEGRMDDGERTYYYYLQTTLLGVRKGPWKLLVPRPATPEWLGPWVKEGWAVPEDMRPVQAPELYNLENDIGEQHDLASSHPEKVKELVKLAKQVRSELGDYFQVGSEVRFYEEGEKRPRGVLPFNKASRL